MRLRDDDDDEKLRVRDGCCWSSNRMDEKNIMWIDDEEAVVRR